MTFRGYDHLSLIALANQVRQNKAYFSQAAIVSRFESSKKWIFEKDVVVAVGSQFGVGKESDIFAGKTIKSSIFFFFTFFLRLSLLKGEIQMALNCV